MPELAGKEKRRKTSLRPCFIHCMARQRDSVDHLPRQVVGNPTIFSALARSQQYDEDRGERDGIRVAGEAAPF
jgi:hypothetical protein